MVHAAVIEYSVSGFRCSPDVFVVGQESPRIRLPREHPSHSNGGNE
jgi:hypothetical protein